MKLGVCLKDAADDKSHCDLHLDTAVTTLQLESMGNTGSSKNVTPACMTCCLLCHHLTDSYTATLMSALFTGRSQTLGFPLSTRV